MVAMKPRGQALLLGASVRWTVLGERERSETGLPVLVAGGGVAHTTPCVAEPKVLVSQPAGHLKLPRGARQR